MKILIIKRDPLSRADGISHFLFSLAGAFLQLGHEVVCAATHDLDLKNAVRERFEMDRYPRLECLVETARMADWRKFFVWRRQGQALVERLAPDLVIVNGAVPVRLGARTIIVAHDVERRWLGPFGSFGRILYKQLTYRLAAQVVTTCPELVAPVARESRLTPAQIQVIPTCIELARYRARPLAERQPVILHMGQQAYKQPAASLAALQSLAHGHARLIVTGQVEGAFARALRRAPAAVRARVELPGIVPVGALKELLATARVVSIPSRYAHPVASPTALEALASHTPAVLSPSVSTQMALDGETAFVENTPAGMARRFDELLSDDARWSRMSARCAEVKERFDARAVARAYLALTPPSATARQVDATPEAG